METIYAIIQQLGKGGNVAALFGGTFGLFAFLESISSKTARADLAGYVTSADVAFSSVQLHEGPLVLFERVFGSRHFSLRCLTRSVMVSLGALAGLAGLGFLHDPTQAARSWSLAFPGTEWKILVSWTILSLVPDYFNLLKTRLVLHALVTRQIYSLSVLLAVVCMDLAVGYFVFVVLPSVTLSLPLVWEFGWDRYLSDFSFPKIVEGMLIVAVDILHFKAPIATFFWAGMLPSIWLWLYLAASLVTRLAARGVPVLRFLTYFLDINEHPLRSVGFIAAVLVSGGYAVYVTVSSVVA